MSKSRWFCCERFQPNIWLGSAVTATGAALTATGALGFSVFMALSGFIKALGLLAGLTVPFGAYVGASTALGAALSPAGLVVLPTAVGGYFLYRGSKPHCFAVLSAIVALMHVRLHQSAPSGSRDHGSTGGIST